MLLGSWCGHSLRGSLPSYHIRLEAAKPPPAEYPRELRTLGNHLRKRRLDLGLLQREVAEQLGVDETTIYNWESGRHAPSAQFSARIRVFLDTPSMIRAQ
jgi:DNA-binding XRE family transcriptional regulator